MSSKNRLGARMKEFYECRTRTYLPRRTYTVLRVDGKAFHTYTRGCERPFDQGLMADMDETAQAMCRQIQGAKVAYVQSDEISLVLTDFDTLATEAWFDGEVQKMVSIAAAIATAEFNRARTRRHWTGCAPEERALRPAEISTAQFDARVFTVPEREEVVNYLIWRQQDATRNSVQMAGQACFSQRELHGLSVNQLQEKLFQERGVNWNDYPEGCKRGRVVRKEIYEAAGPAEHTDGEPVERTRWSVEAPPVFTQQREYLYALLPERPQ